MEYSGGTVASPLLRSRCRPQAARRLSGAAQSLAPPAAGLFLLIKEDCASLIVERPAEATWANCRSKV
jgi:hypothetical protein